MSRSTLKKHNVDKNTAAREQQQHQQRQQNADNYSSLDTQTQSRRRELSRQCSGADNQLVTVDSTEPIVVTDHPKWKCGYSSAHWAKLFAVMDVVKGTFGLIFAAYISISIFRLMAKTPDFTDLKWRMAKTEFVYLFAYGKNSLGISLSVCGMALHHFLLIVFGKILFDGANERSTSKLRLWYVYAFFSTIVFILLYARLILASLECSELQLCQAEHNSIVWIVVISYYFLSFVPTIYSIAIAKSLLNEICRQRRLERRSMALSQSQSRSQSTSQFGTLTQTQTQTQQQYTASTTITPTPAQNSHNNLVSTNNYTNNRYDTYMSTLTSKMMNYEPKITYNPALHPRGFNL